MEEVRNIRIEDFDYPLPEERIALYPLARRDSCKLLVANAADRISHHVFSDLPMLVRPGTLIIANETRVIRARMEFLKATGARIEIFLLEPLRPHDYVTNFASTAHCSWTCLVGNRKRWKEGTLTKNIEIETAEGEHEKSVTLKAELGEELPGNGYEVSFSWDDPSLSFAEIVEAAGNIPIPPYLRRESEASDTDDYQTVYSRTQGSVAAPTAGLHFTPELIGRLKSHGDEFATVTLHVGAGTFQPVKSEEIGGHPMHTEWISVSQATLRRIIDALENGRDIMAVGTTSVRTLESLPYLGVQVSRGADPASDADGVPTVDQWMPYEERFRHIDTIPALKALLGYLRANQLDAIETTTSIMIAPGFRWRIVNRLITNFHQPKSTLLLLVSSFLGQTACGEPRWREVYREALEKDYRFLSYGDACLFTRAPQPAELPLSKSMLLRKAAIQAVATRRVDLPQSGTCDDVDAFVRALRATLDSVAHPEADPTPIFIGEGAAPLRFLTAIAASMPGANVCVTAAPALQRRPILPLIDTLKEMGADITLNETPEWKLVIRGRKLKGGKINPETGETSQYLSALMLASPLWENPLEIDGNSRLMVSKPYLKMTEEMMNRPDIEPEPDWSAAAFLYEYCLATGKGIEIDRLTPPAESLQGDSAAADIFGMLGVETQMHPDESASLRFSPETLRLRKEEGAFETGLRGMPDLVPPLVVALCHVKVPFRITGVGHLRHKECDRLDALQRILMQAGYEVETDADSISFSGEFRPMEQLPVEIDARGDHRMAMAFHPLELLGIVIVEDKDVVSKSFPDFYRQFK